MRNQTPIHKQQRTTQTQQRRSRPHNPSLVRRNQPSGQRTSPLRQMQQQTRQRQRRQRKNTPLPEKRRRTRQTTRRSHAHPTLRHMVNTPTAIPTKRKAGHRRKAGREREEKKTSNKKTQWCSGITCVLAELRAHYPEHQTTKRKRTEEKERRRQHTHTTAPPPNTNHHRHSTMTQPCHKDTHLNQQCCNSKHTERAGRYKRTRTMKERAGQRKVPDPTRTREHHNTRTTRPSTRVTKQTTRGHRYKHEGDANVRKGDHHHSTRPSTTMPPHHPRCHPTIHNEGGVNGGYPTTQRPRTDTHRLHHTHPAANSSMT